MGDHDSCKAVKKQGSVRVFFFKFYIFKKHPGQAYNGSKTGQGWNWPIMGPCL